MFFKLRLDWLHIVKSVMALNKADKHDLVIHLRKNFDDKLDLSQIAIFIGCE